VDALSAAGLDARGVEALTVCLKGKPVSGLEAVAARALMSKLAPPQVRDLFTAAADTGKSAILKELAQPLPRAKAEELASLRLEMGLEAMASANPATAALGLGLLKDARRARDPAYVRGVDEALAKAPDESMRRALETDWCRFLSSRLVGTTDSYLVERLDQLASYQDEEVQGRATFALLAAGRVQRVLDAYPQMLPRARREILRQIEAAPTTPGIAPLLQIALEDGVSDARLSAFRTACRGDFPAQEASAQRLVTALRAERDTAVAAEMKRALQDVVSAGASRTCDSLLLWAVEEGATDVASGAIRVLTGPARDAARNWKMCCDRFVSIVSEANRAAVVSACGAFRVDAAAKIAFCQGAMRDPAPAVREAAFMQLCAQSVSLSEEQRLGLRQTVMAERDSQLKARMDQAFRLGMLAVYRAMPESERRAENVQQQICQHVLNGSEAVAVEALKVLEGTTSDPISILLTKAFVRGTPTVKMRILWTLHLHPNRNALDLLCTALRDKYASVRKEAFAALAARYEVKHEKAGLALLQNAAQAEPDALIRSSFELTLSKVTP
jgi:hypothetical protein